MRRVLLCGAAIFLATVGCGVDSKPAQPILSPSGLHSSGGLDTEVENQLLELINGYRGQSSSDALERDPGHDYLIRVYTDGLARDQTLGSRQAEELAQQHAAWDRLLCAEITQWWGGSARAQVHYDALMGAGAAAHLGNTNNRFIGLSVAEGLGPSGSQYEDRNGSYLGIILCNHPFRLITDPAVD